MKTLMTILVIMILTGCGTFNQVSNKQSSSQDEWVNRSSRGNIEANSPRTKNNPSSDSFEHDPPQY